MLPRQELTKAKRIVIKVGTSTLNYNTGKLNISRIEHLVRELSDLANQGKEIILSFRINWFNDKIITNSGLIGICTEAGAEYVKLKEEMFTEGILSFNDAYDLAFRYIQEKSLNFSSFSDKRFKYLFVDEFQDCDNQQVEFIKKIFAYNKVIVQRDEWEKQMITYQEQEIEMEQKSLNLKQQALTNNYELKRLKKSIALYR